LEDRIDDEGGEFRVGGNIFYLDIVGALEPEDIQVIEERFVVIPVEFQQFQEAFFLRVEGGKHAHRLQFTPVDLCRMYPVDPLVEGGFLFFRGQVVEGFGVFQVVEDQVIGQEADDAGGGTGDDGVIELCIGLIEDKVLIADLYFVTDRKAGRNLGYGAIFFFFIPGKKIGYKGCKQRGSDDQPLSFHQYPEEVNKIHSFSVLAIKGIGILERALI